MHIAILQWCHLLFWNLLPTLPLSRGLVQAQRQELDWEATLLSLPLQGALGKSLISTLVPLSSCPLGPPLVVGRTYRC